MKRSRFVVAALAAVTAFSLTACAGGSSDTVGAESGGDGSGGTINLYAYAVPKVGFDSLIPAFQETEEGEGVVFQQSYGASGDQSRKVRDGAEANFVNFSVEPDITRLVDAGLVDENWNDNAYNGIPFGSVVTIVVREGNPKNIQDWDDLLRPDVEVVTPNPFSSGSAKWNLLAPYAAKSNGGADPQAGIDYVDALVTDHVKVQPKSGREATETFLQGTGDVLLSYENEALFIERNGDPVEHVTPPVTFKIENPAAVLKNAKDVEVAQAFNDFLYTPDAQRLWAETGFRPVDPTVAEEFADEFPQPEKLWTVADLGGWETVNEELFADSTGTIAVIYDNATK
ncbi:MULTISPECIES: sulfate ABC transporter substrate-binding protein [Rhodococcus]|uniref:Sulfate transport system substrate-binding protein n=1 Tax=Rhodococcus rhodochrous J45 TaxID=935266 RepID=A0A562E030_RHORH|nr:MULTISPECIES: sulfate ABC transporter substrate-binding protein [Rhodococcus]MXQ76714.1 sulfate ABC transporter substrate-binding protein [Rhodococcus rhodochrous]TWH15236.1 sulfate transport system substrate-binding protein [Rhodococcus rhodochrous J45]BDB61335.1 sulfate ABC transporter substrate-binding protein [Rhodococcus sp. RDE2]